MKWRRTAHADNMYAVTVQATDADRRMGTKPVTVEVTNVDEPGVVTLSARQPMAGVLLTATITDPDSVTTDNMTGSITTGVDWQWQKGSSNIPNADGETYTPADSDIDNYLRATATYKDRESSRDTKRANARSDYVVLRAATGNNAPEFADDQDPATDGDQAGAARKVAENTEAGENIGAPVRATDADSGQKLTYTLVVGADADDFRHRPGDGPDNDQGRAGQHDGGADGTDKSVTVKATDPAGIPLTDIDNSDTVVGNHHHHRSERTSGGNWNGRGDLCRGGVISDVDRDLALHTYMEDNPEDDVGSTWSVAGADGGKFDITGGALTFKAKPDYENPTDTNKDNVYEVTVRAADADGYIGTMDVKVSVTNVDEAWNGNPVEDPATGRYSGNG